MLLQNLKLGRTFAVACLSWFVFNFPSAHMREIYIYHHTTRGAVGLHPDLVDAYIRKACWQSGVLALLVPLATLLIGKLTFRMTNSAFGCLLAGPIIGWIAAAIMSSQLRPDFLAIANVELSEGGFFYSGLVSGVIVGELCRRYYQSMATAQVSGKDFRCWLLISALMTWAVLLKVLESIYVSSLPPGRDPLGIFHLFMFISVLLWTPLFIYLLWRLRPSRFLPTAVLTVAAGVIVPYLLALGLLYPVTMSLYAGITPYIYGLLWAGLLSKVAGPTSLVATVCIAPGLVWGLIVAVLWFGARTAEEAPLASASPKRSG